MWKNIVALSHGSSEYKIVCKIQDVFANIFPESVQKTDIWQLEKLDCIYN